MLITYKIANSRSDFKYFTALFISRDGGKTFMGPLKAVAGDVGEISPDGVKKITWNIFDEYEILDGNIMFKVGLETERIPLPKKTLLLYSASETAPFGLMIISLKRFGWYTSLRTNGNFGTKVEYSCNDEGLTNYSGDGYYIFDEQVKRSRYSFHLGSAFRASKNTIIYAGLGYGSRQVLWHVSEYSYETDKIRGEFYVDNENYLHNGIEAEGGININLNKFSLGLGINSIAPGQLELFGSIGLVF
jgi:hypothetical protein